MIGTKKKILFGGVAAVLTIVVVVVIVAVSNNHCTSDCKVPKKHVSVSAIGRYKKAAVSTNGQECAQIGVSMLEKNGSAVDAAIAALLCEGVASLHSMGLGGGFLMTIWDGKNKVADYLDARETAPLGSRENMFEKNNVSSLTGGLAVAVPGELLGYWEAHQKYGKLPWKELFTPVIKLCATGSKVTKYLMNYLKENEKVIKDEPSLSEILINPVTNSTWVEGDRIRRPKLAETLKRIADNGPDSFYNGSMAADLSAEINAAGGNMTLEDFKSYRVKWKTPIRVNLSKLTMYTAPPPGSGVILAFIIKTLEGIVPTDNEEIMWQRIVEVFKWAYARRTELGDPDFVDVSSVVNNLTSSTYADLIRSTIRDDWTSVDPKYYGAIVTSPVDSGTSHVSVLAPDGSAVSVTSTINQVFGAKIRSKSTGIIFNDEMDDFSSPNKTNGFDLPASPANYIRPGKRPMSSMTPTIVLDESNTVRLVIGGAGGSKITTGVAISMILNLWAGYDIKEAIDAYRIHHQLIPMNALNEKGFPQHILNYLNKVGHNASIFSGIGSALTGIANKGEEITANSDYRREGKTAGL
ncbi:glutathione hydrolase 1 proenzyme-like [Orussus abietinus]|uniref:glutathione hydrolase 1 proenzyme-like n=1 Tax=Orussus abietinus TaxID=222816 RepID=UPI00062594F1|nr:glutathione hydrolase 1 proenzyme-like [Orussus abietinus]